MVGRDVRECGSIYGLVGGDPGQNGGPLLRKQLLLAFDGVDGGDLLGR